MTSVANSVVIKPARSVSGSITLPGDKSISHRYAMLAAIASGASHFSNFSTGADCASTLHCMRALGCVVKQEGNGEVEVIGGDRLLEPPAAALDCGNSGSTMRMLSGILAGQPFASELRGDESLSRRPMQRVIVPLEMMGARVASQQGKPPLRIHGGALRAIDYHLPVASAQVKSAVLLAGLFADGETWVEEPLPTRDHTELALRAFGVRTARQRARVGVAGGQPLRGIDAKIPGDISSATFFLCAAGLFPESNLVIDNLLLNPTRAVVLDVLAAMGVRTAFLDVEDRHGELAGMIRVQPGKLAGAVIDGAATAAVIDELPVLAAIAPFTENGVEIRDARELRVKETDRIAGVARNLKAMGAEVVEREDGLFVPGGQRLHGASLDSFGDHRIAMAFAVAALRAEGETEIKGADAACISFPEFFEVLAAITQG